MKNPRSAILRVKHGNKCTVWEVEVKKVFIIIKIVKHTSSLSDFQAATGSATCARARPAASRRPEKLASTAKEPRCVTRKW